MPNRRPGLYNKHRVCIICEGNEEYKYIDRLKELKVWNEQYEVSLVMLKVMGISLHDIKTAIKMEPMRLCLFFAIRIRNHMNSMMILKEK